LKRSLVFLLIVLAGALAAAAPAATTAAPAQATRAPLALVKTCSSRYKHAVINGEHKCLGTGQFCAKRNEAIYRRYGFTCKPGSDGRLRLHRR
jgi:outer membrane lipoprotein-sorting protein